MMLELAEPEGRPACAHVDIDQASDVISYALADFAAFADHSSLGSGRCLLSIF